MDGVDVQHYTDSEVYKDRTIRYGFDSKNDIYVSRVMIPTKNGEHEVYCFTSDDLDEVLGKARTAIDTASVLGSR